MRLFGVVIQLLCALCLSLPLAAESMESRVVNIIVTSQKHDYTVPWQMGEITRAAITGCVIEGNRILTAAYSIADHTLIEVLKNGESRKYQAEAVVIDYHCGLAILKVEDNSFFQGLKPVTFSPTGKMTGRAAKVYKWDSMSSFKEYTAELTKSSIRFFEPNCGMLMHQFSTSMNDGGNGEPVFIDDRLAGIATGLSNETKTLYVITTDVIQRMLKDAEDGAYEGVPFFWIDSVELQSDANLHDFFGMGDEDSGVLVTGVPLISSGSDALKKNDIILSIDGQRIDDNGMYDSAYGKLYYYGLIQVNRFVGDTVAMRVLRDRRKIDIRFKLKPVPGECCSIPLISNDRVPRYCIFGGLVMQELTMGYLESAGSEWKQKTNKRLMYYFDNVKELFPTDPGNRVIILNRVLPDTVNKGYQYNKDLVLKSVNGVLVKDIAHLKRIIDLARTRFVVFDFFGETTIVLDRKSAIDGEKDLLKTYNINSPFNVSGE